MAISRTARRRICRRKMGEATFRRCHKLSQARGKLQRVDVMLAQGITVVRDPETKRFMGLRAMRERLGRFLRPQLPPQTVTA